MKLFEIIVEFHVTETKTKALKYTTSKHCFVLADDVIDASEKLNKKLIQCAPDNIDKFLIGDPMEIEFTDCTNSNDTFIS